MWRLSSHTVEINGNLQFLMPFLVRLPDPVPGVAKKKYGSVSD